MFIEITRKNQKGEEKVNLVREEEITDIIELTIEPTNYYDEDGNLVKTEEPTERLFKVFLKSGRTLKITEDTYNALVKKLTK